MSLHDPPIKNVRDSRPTRSSGALSRRHPGVYARVSAARVRSAGLDRRRRRDASEGRSEGDARRCVVCVVCVFFSYTPAHRVGGLDVRVAPRAPALSGGARARAASADIVSASSFIRWPRIREDHPPNLSILVSGGRETNQDFLSSGERTGKSPAPNPAVQAAAGDVVFGRFRCLVGAARVQVRLERGRFPAEGARPVEAARAGERTLLPRVGLLESAALSGW